MFTVRHSSDCLLLAKVHQPKPTASEFATGSDLMVWGLFLGKATAFLTDNGSAALPGALLFSLNSTVGAPFFS